MNCPNCDEHVEVPHHGDLRFVAREDDAHYLILVGDASGTRLVHACGLRGMKVSGPR